MVRLFSLPMCLRYRAGKLLRIRAHNLYMRQIVIQHFANKIFSRLAFSIANLLTLSRKRRFSRPIVDRPHNCLGRRFAFRRRVYSIGELGNDAKVELFLVLFGDGETQNMFCTALAGLNPEKKKNQEIIIRILSSGIPNSTSLDVWFRARRYLFPAVSSSVNFFLCGIAKDTSCM